MNDNIPCFIHESSYVDEGAEIGEGTKIWHFCHIMPGAKIGKKCSIGQNVNVGCHAIIGNGVKIQNNVSVYDDVIIEDDVFCGPSCVFTNVINPRAFVERKHEYKKTIVKKRRDYRSKRNDYLRCNHRGICAHRRRQRGNAGCARLRVGVWKSGARTWKSG